PVFADPLALSAEQWSRSRTGEALVRQPVLVQTLQALERESDGVIVLAHATSEAGQLWAEELRAWFVALGVSSARIRLVARPELKDVLTLDVRKQADL
ncbi:MAG TPA: hypothetical protein VJS66_03875, partial [Burkholderiales bacterium]|nr:hypothetical protein [Burkholderiales bacterium]